MLYLRRRASRPLTQLSVLHLGILFLLGSALGDVSEHECAALSRFEVL
jgi:hypothetical protein